MKKRAMAALFALVLMVGLVLSPGASASTTMYVYTSNGKSLNLRDYPSTDGNVIATIPFGAKVTVDTGFVGSSWSSVQYKGYSGYCMSRYLTDNKPSPGPTPTAAPSSTMYDHFKDCYYTASVRPSSPGGFVHLRWAPSKQQPIRTDYYNGSELLVIAQDGTWCQVYDTSTNVAGFMMASFLVTVR